MPPVGPVPDVQGELSELAAGRSRTLRQFASFVLIGCVNTAVYLAVYVLLNQWIPYLIAHVVAFTVSVIGSFLLNSYITVGTKPTWRGFVRYPLSSLINLVASGALLHFAVSALDMDKNLAALVAGVLVTPISFLLARWAITSGRGARTAAGPPDGTDGTPSSEPPMIKSDSR